MQLRDRFFRQGPRIPTEIERMLEKILYDLLAPYLPHKPLPLTGQSMEQLWMQIKPRGQGAQVDTSKIDYRPSEITWGKTS